MFPTVYTQIIEKLHAIDPMAYGYSRNFKQGAVTRLSPYISRGVLSTKQVLTYLKHQQFPLKRIEKFIQELAWRDYWQMQWQHYGSQINEDLRQVQNARFQGIPENLLAASLGITAIDEAITDLYETGYMHNHMRMYVAAVACNIGHYHWKIPAQWMYYHLLDGDWASNALSWQWVAGTNSRKKYYANQENVNKYFESKDEGTFLDHGYEYLVNMEVPKILLQGRELDLKTELPVANHEPQTKVNTLLIYNYYNLDPLWRQNQEAKRVLLLEPSIFRQFPVGNKPLSFALELAKNVTGLEVFVGSFEQLSKQYPEAQIYFKEHPLNRHYQGHEDPRDWMFTINGNFPSFFAFWKKCKPELYDALHKG